MFGGGSTFGGQSAFGAPKPATAPTFGAFGTPASTQAQGTTSFGFGATPASQPATGGGFGGFGASTQTTSAPTFGGFGATTQQTATPSFTGFGQTATTQAGATSSFTGFGASGQQQAGTGTTGFGGFGQPNATGFSQTSQPTSAFGTAATATPFGGKTQLQTGFGGSTFGGQTQQTPGFGGFGSSLGAGGGFGQQQQPVAGGFGQSMNGMAPGQPQQATITEHLSVAQSQWDKSHPNYQFKHYFYNLVHPDEVQRYAAPNDHNAEIYRQAMINNPDPKCLVPVLALGFDDIKKRTEIQDRQCQAHANKLKELSTTLSTIRNKHYVETLRAIERAKFKHREIVQKTLQLYKQIQLLRQRGYSIRADEEMLRSRLEAMQRELQKPAAFRGRLNEIRAVVNQLKDSQRLAGGTVDDLYAVADERTLELIYEALGGQQEGLMRLTEIVQSDKGDVEMMARKYGEKPHGTS
ncbi:hypothetical protein HDV00_009037 [Rhizophlyctis rosea]|nr:hypothetical protein HDV00_009037 [Rhizophlyctis rosea]